MVDMEYTSTRKENQMLRYPRNVSEFKRQAERCIKKGNPDALPCIGFEWEEARRVTYPTGVKGFRGHVIVRAIGYRTKVMLATADETGGIWVR